MNQPNDEHTESHEGHGSIGLFVTVFFALCILTAMSFASFHILKETPKLSWVVMMAISCTKAMLVISFFMHLKWEANWKYVLTFPALLMSMFLLIMLIPDVGWRLDKVSRERALHMATPQQHHHADGHGDAKQHAGEEADSAHGH